jgi:hypothetical protein
MAELDLTNIAAASIATPAAGVIAVYSELTATPTKRLSTKDEAGTIITFIGEATTDQGAQRLSNKDLDAATTKIVDGTDTTKKWGFSLSGMTTAITLTISSSQSTAQTLTVPNITAADTIMTLNLAQTTGATKTFRTADLLINNPAATFAYTITSAAIVAARVLNLPLTIATDTLMCLGLAQTVTGILTLTTPVIGAATGTSLATTSFIRTSATTTSTQGIGYTAGGQVTQLTSKVTAFTLSRYTGTIQFAADALAADTSTAGATWTNTAIAATDHVSFTHESGGTLGAYNIVCLPAAGSASVKLRNVTPGSLSEAPVFRFHVTSSANA